MITEEDQKVVLEEKFFSEDELKKLFRGFTPQEELIAREILVAKIESGVGYRYEGDGREELGKYYKQIAEGRMRLAREYAKGLNISKKRVKKIIQDIYNRETFW